MKKKIVEPKQNNLTMRQMMGYYKKSKGYNKIQCKGRTDAFRGSLRYQNWLEIINKK